MPRPPYPSALYIATGLLIVGAFDCAWFLMAVIAERRISARAERPEVHSPWWLQSMYLDAGNLANYLVGSDLAKRGVARVVKSPRPLS
jgi:hypothetical protein